jgi:ABC-2 type transport system ATP-binding protein
MIEVSTLTKRYGDKVAVDDLSFTVPSGQVTGFLGPNGAGKSTTMRVIMGLDRATSGSATIDGRGYADLEAPLRHVGALLEAKAIHPGRSARAHLLALAQTHGLSRRRVDEVIDLVGLTSVADRRAGGFSLGMGQRLGLAVALLGDPATIILDEPVNGLDPDGVLWIRTLLRSLAREGRTVLVSSHLMAEMALTADHLIIVGRGRLLADTSVDALIATATNRPVTVTSPDAAALADHLRRQGAAVTGVATDQLDVHGIGADVVGDTAARHGLRLHELHTDAASLEEVYLALTRDSREYGTGTDDPRPRNDDPRPHNDDPRPRNDDPRPHNDETQRGAA